MQERISQQQFYQLQPTLVTSLQAIQAAASEHLEASLIHLIFLRVSQINGCAFCQRMHCEEARRDGEQQARLDVLAGWRHSSGFSDRERTALAWAEQLTAINQAHVSDIDYEAVHTLFGTEGTLNLTTSIICINSWNRVVATCGFQPQLE